MSSRHILRNEIFKQTIKEIEYCCEQNGVDQSHGLPHAIDIACHVGRALQAMTEVKITDKDKQNVILSALLHDVDDRKYFKSENFKNATDILVKVLGENEIQRRKTIVRMIDLVAYSKNGNIIHPQDPPQFYFTRYADRIDAIGLIGLHRCYQYSKIVKNPFYLPETAKPKDKEDLYQIIKGRDQDYIKRGGKSQSVIDHMFDKILHIKLPEKIQKNKYMEGLYQDGHDRIVEFVLQNSKTGYQKAEEDLISQVEKWKKTK